MREKKKKVLSSTDTKMVRLVCVRTRRPLITHLHHEVRAAGAPATASAAVAVARCGVSSLCVSRFSGGSGSGSSSFSHRRVVILLVDSSFVVGVVAVRAVRTCLGRLVIRRRRRHARFVAAAAAAAAARACRCAAAATAVRVRVRVRVPVRVRVGFDNDGGPVEVYGVGRVEADAIADAVFVRLWVAHQQRRRLAVQRVRRVRVAQQLRDEELEDVHQV